jgi:hypothetical protein
VTASTRRFEGLCEAHDGFAHAGLSTRVVECDESDDYLYVRGEVVANGVVIGGFARVFSMMGSTAKARLQGIRLDESVQKRGFGTAFFDFCEQITARMAAWM